MPFQPRTTTAPSNLPSTVPPDYSIAHAGEETDLTVVPPSITGCGISSYPFPLQVNSPSYIQCFPPYAYPSVGTSRVGASPLTGMPAGSYPTAGTFPLAGMSPGTYSSPGMTSVGMTAGPPACPSSPFYITLISGNISVCAGCHGRYVKPALLPHNLCLKHQE